MWMRNNESIYPFFWHRKSVHHSRNLYCLSEDKKKNVENARYNLFNGIFCRSHIKHAFGILQLLFYEECDLDYKMRDYHKLFLKNMQFYRPKFAKYFVKKFRSDNYELPSVELHRTINFHCCFRIATTKLILFFYTYISDMFNPDLPSS